MTSTATMKRINDAIQNDNDQNVVRCTLQHHGAAASSCPNVLAWIPSSTSASSDSNSASNNSTLVYASHGIVNLSQQVHLQPAAAAASSSSSSSLEETTIVWNVTHTLRTSTTATADDCKRTITALAYITPRNETLATTIGSTTPLAALATGFSDGTITVWIQKCIDDDCSNQQVVAWSEFMVEPPPTKDTAATTARSITALDALWLSDIQYIAMVTGSSAGARLYICALDDQQQQQQEQDNALPVILTRVLEQTLLENCCISTVRLVLNNHSLGLIVLLGTAAPRHNRIHVHHADENAIMDSLLLKVAKQGNDTATSTTTTTTTNKILQHVGSLAGHEDWISCMAWNKNNASSIAAAAAAAAAAASKGILLATGSQDCRIRLWKFTTVHDDNASNNNNNNNNNSSAIVDSDTIHSDNDVDDEEDEEEEDEDGESRLEIYHASSNMTTRVTLEALLMGHEERVTAVCWHPKPSQVQGMQSHHAGGDDGETGSNDDDYNLLISSSMDRSILLWAPSRLDGIWTPLTRVGSAGGILGGSVGSTLLGYLNVAIEPTQGRCLIGHAYGGSLHVWKCCHDDDDDVGGTTSNENRNKTRTPSVSTEMVQWRAQPCVTGHFDGVTDLCWEAMTGEYLLTASLDQTCRLWAPVSRAKSSTKVLVGGDTISNNNNHPVWVELARPQVHGYNLSAVASLSTRAHPHLLVTGADEKELRAFDAPMSTIRNLQGISGLDISNNNNKDNGSVDPIHRVDRAYIPSLGLSNRATAADAAEEEDAPEEDLQHHDKDSLSINRVRLPLERDLGAVSLWPEIRKLYGHDTELYCLASTLAARTTSSCDNNDDDSDAPVLVASSCKARNLDDAAIRLWNVEQGKCHQVLKGGHKSTVATLAFSPDGQFLASSGKDRRLCLWQRQKSSSDTSDGGQYELAWAKDVAHKRIVWSVHFLPWKTSSTGNGPASHNILASGSRDGCIKIWRTQESNDDSGSRSTVVLEELTSFAPAFCVRGKPDAVTALSFGPKPCRHSSLSPTDENGGIMALLAVGLESGRLELWKVPTSNKNAAPAAATLALSLPPWQCHLATITKLAWKPQRNAVFSAAAADSSMSILASSSLDHGVRVYQVQY